MSAATPTPFQQEFGRRLREARKAARLTQTALGPMVGLSNAAICNLEKGYQGTSVETLAALCVALDTEACVLVPPTPAASCGATATEGDQTDG